MRLAELISHPVSDSLAKSNNSATNGMWLFQAQAHVANVDLIFLFYFLSEKTHGCLLQRNRLTNKFVVLFLVAFSRRYELSLG